LDGDPSNDPSALLIRDSSGVSVTNSEFQQLKNGVSHIDSDHIVISNNSFHDLRVDGIHGGGSSYVTIADNTFRDFHSVTGDHSDAIQFWTTGTTASVHDIAITGNLVFRGNGSASQGVFMNDEVGTLRYQHVLIADNTLIGTMYNGIAVAHGDDLTISGNTVVGFTTMKSWISDYQGDGATITGNTTNYVKAIGSTNVTETGTQLVSTATDNGAALYQQWLDEQAVAVAAPAALNLIGGAGADTLTGGIGADTLTGGGGADVLTGGAGDDTYIISSKSTIVEAVGGGHDTVVSSASGITLAANVEDLVITAPSGAYGSGNGLDNRITGGVGGDHLGGGGGADTISGGGGGDVITGGAGADLLTGGAGADIFVFTKGAGADVITDFGAGGEHDVLDLSQLYSSGLTSTLTQTVTGVTVSFASGDSIQLLGVHLADLHATATGFTF
jgi:Ca2+-binding RTX toxin-like protein